MERQIPPQKKRKKKPPFILRLAKALVMAPVMGLVAVVRWFSRAKPGTRFAIVCSCAVIVVGLVLLLALSGKPTVPVDIQAPEPTLAPAQEVVGEKDDPPTKDPAQEGEDHPVGGLVLQRGMEADAVLAIQARLMALSYMDSDQPTSFYGPLTYDAIRAFQAHNGLTVNGEIDVAVYNALMSPDAVPYVMQMGDAGHDVEAVQQRLYQLGYLPREYVTKNFGEKTEAALKEFQKKNRLPVNGKVTRETEIKLYDDAVVAIAYQKGDSNSTIQKYQEKLIALGYLPQTYDAKGKMDAETVSAIKNFQDANDLVRDGYLGPATMDRLNSSKAVKYAIRLGMSGSEVRRVQKRLQELNYLSSSQVTGYFGEKTETAIKSFQKRNSLSQDGAVGGKTQDRLFSDSAKKASAPPKGTSGSGSGSGSGGSGSGSRSTPAPKKTGVDKLIEAAQSKSGSNYVRGAKGPNTFDCSGFVHWALGQAGVSHSYMTSIQWRKCTKYKKITSMSSLKRGDILVFTGETENEGHVGIYLGSGKMIDASASVGKVRTTTVNPSNYWQQHFLMAYRIWD